MVHPATRVREQRPVRLGIDAPEPVVVVGTQHANSHHGCHVRARLTLSPWQRKAAGTNDSQAWCDTGSAEFAPSEITEGTPSDIRANEAVIDAYLGSEVHT
ncbi:hypothetical protein [Candidatus Poriferisodalis sp.]|uniref:ABC transporter ATP-binding protein C-terminal domain-containing protein n=1 Tax=Candidatus Poriferisodalis sp. TaxID=3101277 RepID=UPI003C6F8650